MLAQLRSVTIILKTGASGWKCELTVVWDNKWPHLLPQLRIVKVT